MCTCTRTCTMQCLDSIMSGDLQCKYNVLYIVDVCGSMYGASRLRSLCMSTHTVHGIERLDCVAHSV